MRANAWNTIAGRLWPGRGRAAVAVARRGTIPAVLAALLGIAFPPLPAGAQGTDGSAATIKERHMGSQRARAAQAPRSEGDQALVDGWPLYRTERGQLAFNDAMATLKASDAKPPAAAAFKGCQKLDCKLALPKLGSDGWIPAGRLWTSPVSYVLFAHSPRLRQGQTWRRRPARGMRYFVFHEFHNGTRNTDLYDTVSSHSGAVFVPFYMSKEHTDARGHRFVVVLQVAPHDVVSIHATNRGSAGPGVEVAKNVRDELEPLQAEAGILLAAIVKAAAPSLEVVNHRGAEGLPMLRAYDERLKRLAARASEPALTLPFVPAPVARVATVTASLGELVTRRGASAPIPMAERAFVPPKPEIAAAEAEPEAPKAPVLSALATYLRANLAVMKRLPEFAAIIPTDVAAVTEEAPEDGVVYLLDADKQILGRVEPYEVGGQPVPGQYIYVALDREADAEAPFTLDLSRPVSAKGAALADAGAGAGRAPLLAEPRLVEPIRLVSPR